MKIPTWQQIIQECPNLEPCLNADHKGLKLKGRGLPVSISEREFAFLVNFGRKHNCKSGLDFATGTGISALALGLSIDPTKGRVLSIDAYYEELEQQMPLGQAIFANPNYTKTVGFQTAIDLASSYSLFGIVGYDCALWPQDVNKLLTEFVETAGPLDIIMLDGPKTDESVKEALEILTPFLSKNFLIAIHDTHSRANNLTEEYIKNTWNTEWYNQFPDQTYPFMVINTFKE